MSASLLGPDSAPLTRLRAAAVVIATLSATSALLFVFLPPYVEQLRPPEGTGPPPSLPATPLDAVLWNDERLPAVQRAGSFRASHVGDVDGDGDSELVAVGSYGNELAMVVVYDLQGPRPVELANVSWPQAEPWKIRSVLVRQLDDRPGGEVIVGGAIMPSTRGSFTAIQVFTWLDDAISLQGAAMQINSPKDLASLVILPPFVGHGENATFISVSSEYSSGEGPFSLLRSWQRTPAGGYEPTSDVDVNGAGIAAAALVCEACNGSAAAIGVVGGGRASVLVPDPVQGAVSLFNQSAPDFYWRSCAWFGQGNEWEFVALGEAHTKAPQGLATFVFNVTMAGARVGGYVPSDFDVPFRFWNSSAVPNLISVPWAAVNGTHREMQFAVVMFASVSTSTGYRAHYERGVTPVIQVSPTWTNAKLTVYEVVDLRQAPSAPSRVALVGAEEDQPAIMLGG